jgi:hypothetical protein
MAFKVTEIDHRCWPNQVLVGQALGTFGLSIEQIQQSLRDFVHSQAVDPNRGFQQDLADTLKQHLGEYLGRVANLRIADSRYSPRLNEEADLALAPNNTGPRLFIEIEFRPNVEKDLVKFQIGANTGALGVAILVLTLDRNNINRSYTTMPEYSKFVRLIEELRPSYPLLMLGFKGTHSDVKVPT